MTTKHKWLIEPKRALTSEERREHWERIHASAYADVFSLTEDKTLRIKILTELDKFPNIHSVLIPGCGSRTFLQETLAEESNILKICCTDFLKVIKVAKQGFDHLKVEYLAKDSAALGFENEWDAVIIVNSVLSESDVENRSILSSSYRALRHGGVLLGYFPTIFCAIDIDHLDPNLGWAKRIDLRKNTFYEPKQGMHQIFYTPLRLRCILKEIGFELNKMEIQFFDSDYFIKHGAEYYGLKDDDIVVYGLSVIAKKT